MTITFLQLALINNINELRVKNKTKTQTLNTTVTAISQFLNHKR